MLNSALRALPALLLSLFALSFTSCSSTGGLTNALSGPVASALGDLTGFSTNIADWKSKLGGVLDDSALAQVKDYASQAVGFGDTLKGLAGTASDAMKDPLSAIGSKLADMGGINVDELKSLTPAAQMKSVNGFADSAKGVGSMAQDFLKQFGS